MAAATELVPDRRATHYWDGPDRLIGRFRPVLDRRRDTWSVVLLYGPEARWEGSTPPRPNRWTQSVDKLDGLADRARRLTRAADR